MDIKSLNNQFIDRKRADKATVSSANSELKNAAIAKESKSNSVDKLVISSNIAHDLDFAQQVYKKMDESSLDRVRLIRSKVESGVYTSDESIKRLAHSLENDIYELDSLNYSTESESTYPVDIEQLKKNLAENSDIYSEVADRLSKILSNF